MRLGELAIGVLPTMVVRLMESLTALWVQNAEKRVTVKLIDFAHTVLPALCHLVLYQLWWQMSLDEVLASQGAEKGTEDDESSVISSDGSEVPGQTLGHRLARHESWDGPDVGLVRGLSSIIEVPSPPSSASQAGSPQQERQALTRASAFGSTSCSQRRPPHFTLNCCVV